MPLTADDIKRLMPSLEAFLSMKAVEGLGDEATEETAEGESHEMPSGPDAMGMKAAGGEKPGGMAVVIDMKPKGKPGMGGEKVPGCPDCADGTPHEHMK